MTTAKFVICLKVETGLKVEDIITLDSGEWRDRKRAGVLNYTGCLYNCYFEVQNPDLWGDLQTLAVGMAIKKGGASLVKKWGRVTAAVSNRFARDVDWQS